MTRQTRLRSCVSGVRPPTHLLHIAPSVQVCKLTVKDTVIVEPSEKLPPAELVTLQVSRLRPKGAEECHFETAELLQLVQHLQGLVGAAPGARPARWPATINHDFYLSRESTILVCKVCKPRGCVCVWLQCSAAAVPLLRMSKRRRHEHASLASPSQPLSGAGAGDHRAW